jgi:hypothetical protein
VQQVKAYIAHQSKGRMRLRIPECKNNQNSFIALKNSIEQWSQSCAVEVNPATASVLIHHKGELVDFTEKATKLGLEVVDKQPRGLIASATSTELIAPLYSTNQSVPLWQPITTRLELINNKLSQLTSGRVDLTSLLFIALVLQGLIQFIRRPSLIMPWDTAWWFALNVYMMVRQQGE